MCSSEDVNHNLKITKRLIIKAVKQKSDFILTPENSSLFSLKKENLLKMTTTMKNDFYLQEIKKLAKKYRKWILLGSIIVKEKNKLKNRSVLISPKAKVVAYYDKINMYDAVLSTKKKYFESKTFSPGKILKTINLPWGKLGLTICYDLDSLICLEILLKKDLFLFLFLLHLLKQREKNTGIHYLKLELLKIFLIFLPPHNQAYIGMEEKHLDIH